MHRERGLLVAAGPGIAAGAPVAPASIVDLAPTVLHWFGLEVPEEMDGRPLDHLMRDEFRSSNPIRVAASGPTPSTRSPHHTFTPSEEREIMQRLRDLGYLN
jgi:arylsulfatase A-like enzyme